MSASGRDNGKREVVPPVRPWTCPHCGMRSRLDAYRYSHPHRGDLRVHCHGDGTYSEES